MKTNNLQERQNDVVAIKLLKASQRCFKAERIFKYMMIILSFSVCLAAILNRYFVQIYDLFDGESNNGEQIQETIALVLNLVSGGIICLSIPVGFYVNRMHSEGTALQDRYEAYVFNNPCNKSILKPVSDQYVEKYARELRHDKKYFNHIYNKDAVIDNSNAQYEFIKNEVKHDYDLYLYIQPFYYVIWIGFFVIVLAMALSFNDKFVTTLLNILIPSLSAISTIATSWYNCRLQMKQLVNLSNCIERIESLPKEQKEKYIQDKKLVRELADGLFNYRLSPFVIPEFLQRMHENATLKRNVKADKLRNSILINKENDKKSATKNKVENTNPSNISESKSDKKMQVAIIEKNNKQVIKYEENKNLIKENIDNKSNDNKPICTVVKDYKKSENLKKDVQKIESTRDDNSKQGSLTKEINIKSKDNKKVEKEDVKDSSKVTKLADNKTSFNLKKNQKSEIKVDNKKENVTKNASSKSNKPTTKTSTSKSQK